jgi:hypothetical protein
MDLLATVGATALAPILAATLILETEALNAILKYKSDEQK